MTPEYHQKVVLDHIRDGEGRSPIDRNFFLAFAHEFMNARRHPVSKVLHT
jgi:hypothetical protein